jgi:hypothetical protein
VLPLIFYYIKVITPTIMEGSNTTPTASAPNDITSGNNSSSNTKSTSSTGNTPSTTTSTVSEPNQRDIFVVASIMKVVTTAGINLFN